MDNLLTLLKELESTTLSMEPDRVLNTLENCPEAELIESLSGLASDLLINDEGRCIWDLHNELSNAGFPVFAGERDSFGWLTGCIQTSKGIVIYG
jgi:hypothetical protein